MLLWCKVDVFANLICKEHSLLWTRNAVCATQSLKKVLVTGRLHTRFFLTVNPVFYLRCFADYLYSFTSVRNMYAIFYVCVLLFPQPSQRSESRGSCKMKATALLHVTLPTFSFLFHWPQTPDFSQPKNRLLQTLTPPPHFPSPTPTEQAFIGMCLCDAPSLLQQASQSPTSPFRVGRMCMWERRQSPSLYKTWEFLVFMGSDSDKRIPQGFPQGWNLTSEPIEMLAKVIGPRASLKMAFYGQHERRLHSLVSG